MNQAEKRSGRIPLRRALEGEQWEELSSLLRADPGLQRTLTAGLHESDSSRLGRILRGFEISATVLSDEKLRDLARRLLWMLNDESGNHCPAAALALAHISRIRPEIVAPHLPVLKVHAADPGEAVAQTCRVAVEMIEAASRVDPADGSGVSRASSR